ncbi:hypothetical protein UB31_08590 [Bradyrhizobium sp. LTSP849]|uniref:hypothetical protein n=1 Tax=Bradyrhizobium sp. LTSP849 TaxID=1615890 RepID=UPI0005D156D5|nr:hypothetical protein [Bradyrhizobium sp. LTSP849]KJC53463.1 hypothetical protein UB31_08590 [Bradyrhizobium sp. LTSP849]
MTTSAGLAIGVSGHQSRPGIDWEWVSSSLRSEIVKSERIVKAYSSLAVGSDQIFAEIVLSLGISNIAVLPLAGYERYFEGPDLATYRRLLGRSQRVQLKWSGDSHRAFFEAGKYVVDNSNVLFAIWDGKPADGLGGTADIVHYAGKRPCRIVQINPIEKEIRRMD